MGGSCHRVRAIELYGHPYGITGNEALRFYHKAIPTGFNASKHTEPDVGKMLFARHALTTALRVARESNKSDKDGLMVERIQQKQPKSRRDGLIEAAQL